MDSSSPSLRAKIPMLSSFSFLCNIRNCIFYILQVPHKWLSDLQVSHNYLIRCLTDYIIGHYGDFSPPPGASITKVSTAKPEVCPLRPSIISIPFDTGVRKCSRPKESRTDIYNRCDAHFDNLMHKLLHNMHAVVYSGQEHGLVPQGYTGIGKHAAGLLSLFCYF